MTPEEYFAREESLLHDQLITYITELDGQKFIIEDVAARVNEETGEQLFSPATVDRLQQIIRGRIEARKRMVEMPIYSFAA